MRVFAVLAALCGFLTALPTLAADKLKAFPAAGAGMVRHLLQLPAEDEESDFKVQLIVGKTVAVDPGNRYFFAGRIERETIKGWGFPRYVVGHLGPLAGTLMATDPGTPKVKRFVTLAGDAYLIGYNSRLPVVVYAPQGVEVRYRLWRASPESRAIDPG
ncbi:MAG: ecotin family protein [Candidatus Accumulibacter sp.]|uniref:ecotin n=1 Tax=Accumulibacter sp. TaxID=2053492 RepID=UPI001DAA1312|nr:ecotin family protein [Accumulibacter sp.]MCB1942455.1 ecotin family protein [Accumulibacter sp.]